MVIYVLSGPRDSYNGGGATVRECEWEGVYCKDVEELEAELEGKFEEVLEAGREEEKKRLTFLFVLSIGFNYINA